MGSHRVTLISRQIVAERTVAFYLSRPAEFTFKPGQFVDLGLIRPPETDQEGNSRTLSLAGAPHESNLMVATRLRDSAFKRVLSRAELGSEFTLDGPFGNFTLHNNAAKPAILVAGGIGVTPFRSIVLRAANEHLSHEIFLFFSNRRPQDAPFLSELISLQNENPRYRLIPTITDLSESYSAWKGERGHISIEMISRHVTAFDSAIFYVAGPPGMVAALDAVLQKAGIDPDNIRTEEFAGY